MLIVVSFEISLTYNYYQLEMISRQIDYGSYSNQRMSGNYGDGRGYGTDSISLPMISPYGYSSPQINPYPYQFQSEPKFQPIHNSLIENTRKIQNPPINENKSFLDGFDNNNSALLNQQKSHARNIKGRLFNEDPNLQKAKVEKQSSYRDQLQRQIEETRRRKQEEKDKIQKEELERERKFYQEFKIQAQVKQSKDGKDGKNDDNGYFMARTLQKIRKGKSDNDNTKKQAPILNPIRNSPIRARGKTYQNKSSLDNWGGDDAMQQNVQLQYKESGHQDQAPSPKRAEYRLSKLEQDIMRERSNEEERLSKLLLFQQRVLQKISDIKTQIRNTSFDLDVDKQLQRVRNNLRAKPIPFDDELFKSNAKKNNFDTNHYYSLPRRQVRAPPTRYSVKLRDINSRTNESPQRTIKSQLSEAFNDKNKISKFSRQNQQNLEEPLN